MGLEEVLAVLLGWIGLEVEVSTHGTEGSDPVLALEARGILRKGEEFEARGSTSASLAFRIDDPAGNQVASLRLYESAFVGGGWFDHDKEVLEVRSGTIRILVTTSLEARPATT
jgi:hypothetical protein